MFDDPNGNYACNTCLQNPDPEMFVQYQQFFEIICIDAPGNFML